MNKTNQAQSGKFYSIRTKLTAIILLVAIVPMLFGAAVIIYLDSNQFRNNLIERTKLVSRTVGSFAATDIAFSDKDAAANTLKKLDSFSSIINAHLYDENGKLFISLKDSNDSEKEMINIDEERMSFDAGVLNVQTPIEYNEKKWGYIHLQVSTDELNQRIFERMFTIGFICIGLIVLALILARNAQKIITTPILKLSSTTEDIAKNADFKQRVHTTKRDELGILYRSFNSMLETLEFREKERDSAQLSLRESQARFEAIFNAIPDAIVFANVGRKIVLTNPATSQIFGYMDSEMLGKTTKFLYANEEEFLLQGNARFNKLSKNKSDAYEIQYKRKNGEVFWSDSYGVKVIDDSGNHIGFIGIIKDITDRKSAEEELSRYRLNLEELIKERTNDLEIANEELKTFSYSVSHDLRSPLRAIDGFSQALDEDYGEQLDDMAKQFIQKIRHNTKHMNELINDMLQLSRVTQQELSRTRINLSERVHDCIDDLKTSTIDRHVDIRIEPNVLVDADPGLLDIVITNLIGNAWKYSGKENNSIIEFGVDREEGRTIYFVKDNGAGFDMKYADGLFTPFKRLHTTNEFEGTGVGLATAARVIHRHGGEIWAEAKVDEGAKFCFTLVRDKSNRGKASN